MRFYRIIDIYLSGQVLSSWEFSLTYQGKDNSQRIYHTFVYKVTDLHVTYTMSGAPLSGVVSSLTSSSTSCKS